MGSLASSPLPHRASCPCFAYSTSVSLWHILSFHSAQTTCTKVTSQVALSYSLESLKVIQVPKEGKIHVSTSSSQGSQLTLPRTLQCPNPRDFQVTLASPEPSAKSITSNSIGPCGFLKTAYIVSAFPYLGIHHSK